PMLAKAQVKVPDEAGVWSYEPKWDGFRALAFRDSDTVVLQSRSGKELGRYFPELLDALRDELADRCVLDGEVVVPREIDGRVRLDWESLSQRIHPAESRVRMLAEQTPACFIAFDLLALGADNLMDRPFSERRAALVDALGSGRSFHVTPATTDIATARRWFDEFEGAGLDGLIAKPLTLTYQPDKRVMFKIKHQR
ncbi:ATP-dependent DNA ligase, partial [Mycolicibacterium fortuitum]|uniref:ATP-dependent DNA ligase n=1 Tax=Mycolicibacterium fortuitum TaxID=1766 RepID=UPI0020C413AA